MRGLRTNAGKKLSRIIEEKYSVNLRQTPYWAYYLTGSLFIAGLSAIIGSSLIRLDHIITVPGTLRPSSGVKRLVAPVSGLIISLKAKDGQKVMVGDVLVVFDSTVQREELDELKRRIAYLNKQGEISSRVYELKKQSYIRNIELSRKITDKYKWLSKIGAQSELTFLNQKKTYEDAVLQLEAMKQEQINSEINSKKEISMLESKVNENVYFIRNSVIKSPANGYVFDMKVSVGQAISATSQLLEVIPTGSAIATVYVPGKDIGLVRLGQEATIRLESYDYSKYGELKGRISNIGADAAIEEDMKSNKFKIEILIDNSRSSKRLLRKPWRQGMALTANIKLTNRPIISILTESFMKSYESLKAL